MFLYIKAMLQEEREKKDLEEEWSVIEKALPAGWEAKAKETRALFIEKSFRDAKTLLRVMLMHLSEGLWLRETAVRASACGLVTVTDVALLKKLRRCGEWFQWLTEQLIKGLCKAEFPKLPGRNLRLVDASVVCEPGSTGSTWRIHYGINLTNVCCDEVHVTEASVGESLTHYTISPGDVLMADRGLAHRCGIRHVISSGGDVLVRMNLRSIPLETESGQRWHCLEQLSGLAIGQAGEWQLWIRDKQGLIPVRVCALKKSVQQTRQAQAKLRATAKRKQRTLLPETIEAAGYVIVLTTLSEFSAEQILELYRCRWQVELAFKRLKSLLSLGHLKKKDLQGAKAWLQGKLLVACLIETLIAIGDRFSPWGYWLPRASSEAVSMA
jgi:hypothetical protein